MSTPTGLSIDQAKPVADREDAGQVIHLHDASDEPLYYEEGKAIKPVTATVVGTYSHTYRRAQERLRERMLASRRARLKSAQVAKHQLELEASCVIAWAGVRANGQPIECNRANVVALLEAAPWVREQVVEAMEDHEGFFGSASTT